MYFDQLVNNLLKEEVSREDRIKALKSNMFLPVFKFASVMWKSNEEIPEQIYKYLNHPELTHVLGFVGNINRFVERYKPNPNEVNVYYDICFCDTDFPRSGVVSNYLRVAIDHIELFTDVLKYDKTNEYWICGVDVKSLMTMVDELVPEEDDDDDDDDDDDEREQY